MYVSIRLAFLVWLGMLTGVMLGQLPDPDWWQVGEIAWHNGAAITTLMVAARLDL